MYQTFKGDKNDNYEDLDIEEKKKKKLPFPKSIAFIISNEFCERFSYYGMRSKILFLFSNFIFGFFMIF